MVESTQTSPEIQRLSAGFPSIPRSKHWTQCLQRIVPYGITGHVRSIRGTTVVVDGLPVPVGSLVRIHRRNQASLNAEVIGFDGGRTILAPLESKRSAECDHRDSEGHGSSDHVALRKVSGRSIYRKR